MKTVNDVRHSYVVEGPSVPESFRESMRVGAQHWFALELIDPMHGTEPECEREPSPPHATDSLTGSQSGAMGCLPHRPAAGPEGTLVRPMSVMQSQTTIHPPDRSQTLEQFQVIDSMQSFVNERLGTLLKPVGESWQPTDWLPDLAAADWRDQLVEFRDRASGLPDDVLVILVGDMITEEALPSYQTWLNRLQGLGDPTGASDSPWARWGRGWTAEENRHGDLLNKYLYLTGRVDMRAVETSIHHLINNGFDPQTGNDPYCGFVYTSFQERATKISHRNVGDLARQAGEERLHRICDRIAADEARHERAYKLFMGRVFELDPSGAVLAFARMMKTKIVMPALLMDDGECPGLFARFSRVAQKAGVYTAADYAAIIGALVQEWKVAGLKGLSAAAAEAQEFLCDLPERYHKLAGRIRFSGSERFSWIYDRPIRLDPTIQPAPLAGEGVPAAA
jgi:acyl-[acyl-carrier-protein] desaturase